MIIITKFHVANESADINTGHQLPKEAVVSTATSDIRKIQINAGSNCYWGTPIYYVFVLYALGNSDGTTYENIGDANA